MPKDQARTQNTTRRAALRARLQAEKQLANQLVALARRMRRPAEALEASLQEARREIGVLDLEPTARQKRVEARETRLLQRMAARGAWSLRIRQGRREQVSIDGSPWFYLTPQLLLLLLLISDDRDPEPDGFAGWQSYQRIANEFQRAFGNETRPKSILQAAHRLRGALRHNAVNPYYVEARESKGLRFRNRHREVDRGIDLTGDEQPDTTGTGEPLPDLFVASGFVDGS